jgi:hypothetical protein
MKMLKKGDTGADVKTLQTALKIKVDGAFGPITEKAVIRFQLTNNLPVTGIVDSDAWILILNKKNIILEEIDEDTDVNGQYFKTRYGQLIHRYFLPKGEYIQGPIYYNRSLG